MQILKVSCRSRDDFLAQYLADLPDGGLFCPTTEPLADGSEVVLELAIAGLPNKVFLRGMVRSWRRASPRLRIRAGAQVEFLPEEKGKLDVLLDAVRGLREHPARRKQARLPVEVPVRFRTQDSASYHEGVLRDISLGGALLRSKLDLPAGHELVIELVPPGSAAPMAISGRVAQGGRHGLGVRFVYRDGGGSRRIRELVRRLRQA
jgi:Tfp pilus assembly protein PilZ